MVSRRGFQGQHSSGIRAHEPRVPVDAHDANRADFSRVRVKGSERRSLGAFHIQLPLGIRLETGASCKATLHLTIDLIQGWRPMGLATEVASRAYLWTPTVASRGDNSVLAMPLSSYLNGTLLRTALRKGASKKLP